eukprot:3040379-Alexandrium_andersonii.AAC.1
MTRGAARTVPLARCPELPSSPAAVVLGALPQLVSSRRESGSLRTAQGTHGQRRGGKRRGRWRRRQQRKSTGRLPTANRRPTPTSATLATLHCRDCWAQQAQTRQ